MPSLPEPIRVADCPACGELFTLPDEPVMGTLACPHCEAVIEAVKLNVREASPAIVTKAEPAPAMTEPAPPADDAAASPADSESPTLAEWLSRDLADAGAAPHASTPDSEKSEGWSIDDVLKATAPQAPQESSTPQIVDTPSFEASPPSEQEPSPFVIETDDSLTPEQAITTAEASFPEVASAKKKRGLLAPLAAMTMLFLAIGLAGYLVWQQSDALQGLAQQGDTQPAETDQPAPPFEATRPPVEQSNADQPLLAKSEEDSYPDDKSGLNAVADQGAVTASYEADLGPSVASQPSSPPASTPPIGDRYASSVGDRYGGGTAEKANPFFEQAPAFDEIPQEKPKPDSTLPDEPDRQTPSDPFGAPPASLQALEPLETAAVVPSGSPVIPDPETPPATVSPEAEMASDTSPVAGAPQYGAAQLREALDTGGPSVQGFVAVDITDPEQVVDLGQHYARLCYLAQVVTFFDSADPDSLSLGLEAAGAFETVFASPTAKDASRQVAGAWIAWDERPHGGVFFAAPALSTETDGRLTVRTFELSGSPVTVVSEIGTESGGGELGVIGVVVENPAERIPGYGGAQQRVVWARVVTPLEELTR